MNLYIIIASQEFDSANHRFLWSEMANHNPDSHFLVVNIPADQIVTRLKRKQQRIKESKKGIAKKTDNFFLLRPLFFLRPEITPPIFFSQIAKKLIKSIDLYLSLSQYEHIFVLAYNAIWIKILKSTYPNLIYSYYLFDEVRIDADTGKINKKRLKLDSYACKNASVVFSMSDALTSDRKNECKRIVTIGNGCVKKEPQSHSIEHFNRSYAFIGVFRPWIDEHLLLDIVKETPNYTFFIVGTIDKKMKTFFDSIVSKYNVRYLGSFEKNQIGDIYKMFDSIIIPYKQNDFIYKTRPIKIVESIFSGVPVITVPVSGYSECSFIKYATNSKSFAKYIEWFSKNPINIDSNEYNSFVNNNSWGYIAKIILKELEELLDK